MRRRLHVVRLTRPHYISHHSAHGMPQQQGQKRKRPASKKFEVVPVGYTAAATSTSTKHVTQQNNTLAQAFSGAMSKADERWFRKAGYGLELHEAYYRGQKHVVPLDEYAKFEAVIKRPLPVTFRLCDAAGSRRAEFERRLLLLGSVTPVAWAPHALGIWQAAATIDKRSLSKATAASGGGEEALATALVDGVSAGWLHRQECVSMLPVLALRVPAGACVLDLCASPGSKTMQLLECVARGDSGRGLVMANDAHPKRVAALLDSVRRHHRPENERRRLVVACHRGEAFPSPSRPFRSKDPAASAEAVAAASIGFDRVLCDVPCSGDGTVRKDPTVLPRWTPAVGTQLHATQLAIAWRGLELLKVGGTMAYSTCSLNPTEDEAVVAALLARAEAIAPGAVRLARWPIDVLPKLVRRAGLSTWLVADHVETHRKGGGGAARGLDRFDDDDDDEQDDDAEVKLRWHGNYEAAVAARMPHALPSLWPPAEAAAMNLDRCSRLLPHDQDTGGFFIALLKKRAPLTPPGSAAAAAAKAAAPSLPPTGPAACRELPPLPTEEQMLPLSKAEAQAMAARHGGLQAAKKRLLRRGGGGTAAAVAVAVAEGVAAAEGASEVHVAPAALAAFDAQVLRIAHAGMPISR